MKNKSKYIIAVILPLFIIAACVTPNPDADKFVVRTEQTLKISLAVYDNGMDWYVKNHQNLNQGTKDVFVLINKEFPTVYKATDEALQLYKARKTNDVFTQLDKLNALITQLLTLVKINGGPDLTPKETK